VLAWILTFFYVLMTTLLIVLSLKYITTEAWVSLALFFWTLFIFLYFSIKKSKNRFILATFMVAYFIGVSILFFEEILFWIGCASILTIVLAKLMGSDQQKKKSIIDSITLVGILLIIYPSMALVLLIGFSHHVWETIGVVDIATLLGYLMSQWRYTARAFSGICILLMIYLAPKLFKTSRQEFVAHGGNGYITLDDRLAKLYNLKRMKIKTKIQIDRLYEAIKTLDTIITGYKHLSYRRHYWSLVNLMTQYGDKRLNTLFRRYWSYPQDKYLPFLHLVILGPTIGLGSMFGLPTLVVYLLAVDTLFAVVTGGVVEVSYWMIVARAPITYALLIAAGIYFLGSYVAGWYYLWKIRGSEYLLRKARELMEVLIEVLGEVLPFRLRVLLAGAYRGMEVVGKVGSNDIQLNIAEF